MRWTVRVNGNGQEFRQWHSTALNESPPEWGPGEAFEGCPVCGERYELGYRDIKGTWHTGSRYMVYHDPVMHHKYQRDAIDAALALSEPQPIGVD